MKQDKEQWTEDVMRSLDGMRQAGPGPFLYNRIMARLSEPATDEIPKVTMWLAAASFVLVLLLNFEAIRNEGRGAKPEQQQLRELALQYQMLNTNNTLYN